MSYVSTSATGGGAAAAAVASRSCRAAVATGLTPNRLGALVAAADSAGTAPSAEYVLVSTAGAMDSGTVVVRGAVHVAAAAAGGHRQHAAVACRRRE